MKDEDTLVILDLKLSGIRGRGKWHRKVPSAHHTVLWEKHRMGDFCLD